MAEIKKIATRESYGNALKELAGEGADKLVVLDADLSAATKTGIFKKAYPNRHINCGIAESNMMCVAAGLSTMGLVPFASSFAMFAAGRAFEQVRNTIGYPHLNVKIGATHAGISVGEDGASHQCCEDFGLMRSIPGMVVICPADDIDPGEFTNAISDEIFEKIVAVIRIAVPYTGMIVSTRESQKTREKVLGLGISQISGGSRTSVGGYVEEEKEEDNSAQFDVSDRRTLDEVVNWLLELGYIPSFCTACYREGRTGDRFMKLLKSGQIVNCCQPNALMTLKEYLEDYASDDTKQKGEKVIQRELEVITNPTVKEKAREYIENIHEGQRDFRF